MEGGEGGMIMKKKAEIDTSAPFASVKEAVILFGERVLATEVYANKLKEMHEATSDHDHQIPAMLGHVTAELEETKESLQKAQEETILMATCLSSLQQELERTKRELQQLKQLESDKQIVIDPEIEDIKFIENSPKFEKVEFQRKRYVRFAANHNEVSFGHVIVQPPSDEVVLERHPSLRRKKKKSLIPLISGLFSRKKASSEVA